MENLLKRKKPRDMGSLKRRMLQLLGIDRAYVRSAGVNEENDIHEGVTLDYSPSKQLETALLEAERKKAWAIMEIERQRMRML